MKLIKLTRRTTDIKRLNFAPSASWPVTLPPLTAEGYLITAFDRFEDPREDAYMAETAGTAAPTNDPEIEVLQLDQPLLPAFLDAYPSLSLAEIARLQPLWPRPTEWPTLVERYRLRWNDDLELTLQAIRATPLEFQNWSAEKGLGLRDFGILKAFETLAAPSSDVASALINQKNEFLKTLPLSKPSHQEGIRLLELALECLLRDNVLEINPGLSASAWLKLLENKRFTTTQMKDSQRKDTVKKLPFPIGMKAQWLRQGDTAGLEIRIHISQPGEYRKKVESLQDLSGAVEDLWKSHS